MIKCYLIILCLVSLFVAPAKAVKRVELWEGFEGKCLWSAASWENAATSAKVSRKYASEKKRCLRCQFKKVTTCLKASFCLEQPLDWSQAGRVYLDVFSAVSSPLLIDIAISTGGDWTWYESRGKTLKPGWNKNVTFDLYNKDFKTGETSWTHTSYLHHKEQVKQVSFNVFGPPGEETSGCIYLDNIRLESGGSFPVPIKARSPEYEVEIVTENYSAPRIAKFEANVVSVGQYEKFELTMDIETYYRNGYNPDEVDVTATFSSPSGKGYVVPGFLFQEFDESGSKIGGPNWKVRFSPSEVGRWEYIVNVKNPVGRTVSQPKTFMCVSSMSPGFVRTREGRRYFRFDNGNVFFPVGYNVCWVNSDDNWSYEDYFRKLAQSGCNWTRIWNCPWGIILEWCRPRSSGLGRYSQKDCWKFDELIETAEEKGIYIQMCINYHGMFRKDANWERNPYGVLEGGPCKNSEDFFTDEIARKYFKRKLRYLIARWGYSTNVFAWELFNEVDIIDNYHEEEVTDWHREMVEYLKKNDPARHLVTTSFARPNAGAKIWDINGIDYVQIHLYVDNIPYGISRIASAKGQEFSKPVMISEIGGSIAEADEEARDKEGIRLHDALWGSLASGLSGTSMYWWWDGYIRANNLYSYLSAFSGFLKGIRFVDKTSPVRVELPLSNSYADITISPVLDWEKSTGSEFVIDPTGQISGGLLSRYLQSSNHPEMCIEPTFIVSYPQNGHFSVHLQRVAKAGATLEIYLDEKLKLRRSFPVSKSDVSLDKEYRVNIPAGNHRIRLANKGNDWLKIRRLIFGGVAPEIEIMGWQSDDFAMLWLKNRQRTPENYLKGLADTLVAGTKIKILDFPEGNYKVEYWDTDEGKILSETIANTNGEILRLDIPEFSKDIACKIIKER